MGVGAADHHGQRHCRFHSSHNYCTEGWGEVRVVGEGMSDVLGGEGWAQAPKVPSLATAMAYHCRSFALTPTCVLGVPACCAWPVHWEIYAHTLSLDACVSEKNSTHAPTIQRGPITTLLTMSIASTAIILNADGPCLKFAFFC